MKEIKGNTLRMFVQTAKFVSKIAGMFFIIAQAGWAQTTAERLAASYTALTSMTCVVRREVVTDGREALHLSRVWFARPDKLRVEASLPVTRIIVADGADLFYHISGDSVGFHRPISDLNEDMRIEIRRVPGTAMEHLLRLLGIPELPLEPKDKWPVRKGYAAGKMFVVLNLDASERLARVEVFDGPKMENRIGLYDFSAFREFGPGILLSCRQESCFQYGGKEIREITRIENPVVNSAIPGEMFEAAITFTGIVFTAEGDLGF